MSFRRYEIILPTRYNDGTPVEQTKYLETAEDVLARFSALTWQPETLRGTWIHQDVRYDEENVRFFVDVEDTAANEAFFARLKEILKNRFGQIDIWVASYEIRIT
jgi:hypothetical protein